MQRTSPLDIRLGTLADSAAIARILAAGWQQAYSGFMPKEMLHRRADPVYRAGEITEWLSSDFDPAVDLLLVAERADTVLGFVAARLGDRDDTGAASKITLLYVTPEAQGQGVGRQLLLSAISDLKERAPGAITIAAYEQSPFRSFYSFIGGRELKSITSSVDGREWPLVIYHWSSLEGLEDGIRATGRS
ncbi:GNAT family N-acetyltransferase [Microvirga terricola]|uniref:GNAT family N-acetyltransferase n=1 Tax=Microvirga terricola TaxID=2719797 RepID=A0ABX0VC35_9HYPH|nr:GNAT family N-acetyltransferase [Microvirga terricola]NIX76260.1 GNAT family N-acetyltransferase [Microvirga terricola]